MVQALATDLGKEHLAPLGAPSEGEALERVALALNSTLELKEVLRRLGQVTLDVSGADRCSLFLLEDDLLHPAVCLGVVDDDRLWDAFKSMEPIDIRCVDSWWGHLVRGRAVAIEDAYGTDLLPESWIERFDLHAVVAVPLLAAGRPCGLMAVDYARSRSFTAAELALLETVGSYAGVAVRNARLFDSVAARARIQEAVAEAAADLLQPLPPTEVARRLTSAFAGLVNAPTCAVALFPREEDAIVTVAVGGPELEGALVTPPPAWASAWDVVRDGLDTSTSAPAQVEWLQSLPGFEEDRYHLTLPLWLHGEVGGAVLLGWPHRPSLDSEELAATEALASMASSALERAFLSDRLAKQLRRVEVLYDLSETVASSSVVGSLVRRLNEVLASDGIKVVGIAVRERSVARRLGASELSVKERAAWRSGQRTLALGNGVLALPVRLGRRVIGSLHVEASGLEHEETPFLETLANSVAEVIDRAAMRVQVEETRRERAVTEERGRIAADLHDTAGQMFVAISLLARRESEQLPADSPWAERFDHLAELAERGKWEINRAIQALSFFPAARRGLAASIRALARSFEEDSGIRIAVDVEGLSRRLSPRTEQALYRVAHEALANSWRHGRGANVRVHLTADPDEVVLTVTDDGVGFKFSEEGPRVGISSMRRAMDEVGGNLRIRNVKPHGVRVEARVSKEGR